MIKTDNEGNEEWNQTFDGDSDDYGHSVQQTNDGNYIITGSKGQDIWLIKTDQNGDMIWDISFDYGNGDSGQDIKQTSDDGYIITGYTFNNTNDVFVL